MTDHCLKYYQLKTGATIDNALTENWFNSFKNERVYGFRYETRAEMTAMSFEYIERYSITAKGSSHHWAISRQYGFG